jgi:hypothetical protein
VKAETFAPVCLMAYNFLNERQVSLTTFLYFHRFTGKSRLNVLCEGAFKAFPHGEGGSAKR